MQNFDLRTVIGDQGGRQDVGEEKKVRASHKNFVCVTKQGLASVLSLSREGFSSAAPIKVHIERIAARAMEGTTQASIIEDSKSATKVLPLG